MASAPRCHLLIGSRHRKAKRQGTSNKRWLHLGAINLGAIGTLQMMMAQTSLFSLLLSNFILTIAIDVEHISTSTTDMGGH
jgi:hypothetical protein